MAGSGIKIDPKNKGKYTARAASHGKSISQQASADLKSGSKASAKQKRRANFARMAKRGFRPLARKSGR